MVQQFCRDSDADVTTFDDKECVVVEPISPAAAIPMKAPQGAEDFSFTLSRSVSSEMQLPRPMSDEAAKLLEVPTTTLSEFASEPNVAASAIATPSAASDCEICGNSFSLFRKPFLCVVCEIHMCANCSEKWVGDEETPQHGDRTPLTGKSKGNSNNKVSRRCMRCAANALAVVQKVVSPQRAKKEWQAVNAQIDTMGLSDHDLDVIHREFAVLRQRVLELEQMRKDFEYFTQTALFNVALHPSMQKVFQVFPLFLPCSNYSFVFVFDHADIKAIAQETINKKLSKIVKKVDVVSRIACVEVFE